MLTSEPGSGADEPLDRSNRPSRLAEGDASTSRNEVLKENLKELGLGATAVAAIASFVAAPALEFAPTMWLVIAGIMLAFGVGGLWMSALGIFSGPKAPLRSLYAAGAGVLGLYSLVAWGGFLAATNDKRCFAIQREMLLPSPRRDDLPELFTALKCHVQGVDDVQFPKAAVASKSTREPISPRATAK